MSKPINSPDYDLETTIPDDLNLIGAREGASPKTRRLALRTALVNELSAPSPNSLKRAASSASDRLGSGANRGALVCDWSATRGTMALSSSGAGEAFSYDTAVLFDGKPTARCNFSTGSNVYVATYTFAAAYQPYLGRFKSIQIPIKMTWNGFATPFQLWIVLASGKQLRIALTTSSYDGGAWAIASFNRTSTWSSFAGGMTALSDFDAEKVASFTIVCSTTGNQSAYPLWLGAITVNARSTARVSLVFDGNYVSQYDYARPLMARHRMRASFALIGQTIGGAGYFSEAQMAELYAQGHEFIHHTWNSAKINGYANATDWPTGADITADYDATWAYLTTKGWTRGIGHAVAGYSAPYGGNITAARQAVLRSAMQAAGVKTSRQGTAHENSLHPISGANAGAWDSPLMIVGAGIMGTSVSLAQMKAIVDQAVDSGEWAVFTFHQIVADSATPSGNDVKATDLSALLDYIAGFKSDVMVAPMGEIADEFVL